MSRFFDTRIPVRNVDQAGRDTVAVLDEPIELPTRGHTHRAEEDGVIEAHRVIHRQLRWIFREQRDDDYGVDAHIEVVSDNDQVTGKNIGAQIKSGSSWFKAVRGGWMFTVSHPRFDGAVVTCCRLAQGWR